MEKITVLDGDDLDYLRRAIANSDSVRIHQTDNGVKISVNQAMWTLPLGRHSE